MAGCVACSPKFVIVCLFGNNVLLLTKDVKIGTVFLVCGGGERISGHMIIK